MRYTCNLKGKCEPSQYGMFNSLVACTAQCTSHKLSSHEQESYYLTLAYNPEQLFELAPSDQVAYIRREYGLVTPAESTSDLLISLLSNDYIDLYCRGYLDYLH